jgi:phage-related protein
MPVSRPMPEIGAGVEEIRIRDRSGSYRAFYLARLERGILIFMHHEENTRDGKARTYFGQEGTEGVDE